MLARIHPLYLFSLLTYLQLAISHPLVSLRSLHHARTESSLHKRQAHLIKRHKPIRHIWNYPDDPEGYNYGDNIRSDALAALDHLIPKGDGDRDYWTCHVFSLQLPDPDADVPDLGLTKALAEEFNGFYKRRYRNPVRNVDGSASVVVVAQITHPADDRFFAYVQMVPEKPGVKLTMFEQAYPGLYGEKPSDGLEVTWRSEELFYDPDRAKEALPLMRYLGRVGELVEKENWDMHDPEHGKIMQGVYNAADNVTAANPIYDGKMNRPTNFRDSFASALVGHDIVI
ncbi:MAG: hypothetical protein M1820_000525 [Bogoriella megaspora]|nr:MAG: hypothetical protein M1820_000525 [Bogoriella megaspora]